MWHRVAEVRPVSAREDGSMRLRWRTASRAGDRRQRSQSCRYTSEARTCARHASSSGARSSTSWHVADATRRPRNKARNAVRRMARMALSRPERRALVRNTRKVPRSSEIFIRLSSAHGRVERRFVAHVVTTLGGREEASRWISRTTPPSRRKKRRVSRTAVAVLALLVLATGWKLRSSGESGGSDDEASNLELHKMQLEGRRAVPRGLAVVTPRDTERLHHLDEPETAHHREGRVATPCAATRTVVSAFTGPDGLGERHVAADADASMVGPRVVTYSHGDGDGRQRRARPEPRFEPLRFRRADPLPTIQAGVVNAQHVDPTKDDHPRWMRDMWSEKTAAVAVSGSELDSKLESIPDELSAMCAARPEPVRAFLRGR